MGVAKEYDVNLVAERIHLRHCVFASGERLPMLVYADTLPVSLPLRFVLDQVRNRSQPSTIDSKLRSIRYFYAWAAAYTPPFDPEQRLRCDWLLSRNEIMGFARFLRARGRDVIPFAIKSVGPRDPGALLSNNTFNLHLTNVREFVTWAVKEFVKSANDRLVGRLQQLFDAQKLTGTPSQRLYGLTADEEKELLTCSDSQSRRNPFNRPVRFRNQVLVRVLLETGIRRGELCKLRLEDIQTKGGTSPYIDVVRRPDDPDDPRNDPPAVKRLSRRIPISSELRTLLVRYQISDRGRTKHPYLFTDPSTLDPIGKCAVNRIVANLSRCSSLLSAARLTPHTLRRTFNGHLWRRGRELGWSDDKVKQITNYVNGWKETSNQAAVYQRRMIEADAFELLGTIQTIPQS